MYAQLSNSQNIGKYKLVNLVGDVDVGITPELVSEFPNNYIDLNSKEYHNAIENNYYDSENDIFVTFEDLIPPIAPVEPNQPTNAEVAQMISDLQADLIIAGVI